MTGACLAVFRAPDENPIIPTDPADDLGGILFEQLKSNALKWATGAFLDALTAIGLLAIILNTSPSFGAGGHRLFRVAILVVWIVLAVEYAARFGAAATKRRLLAYIVSAQGLIDLLAVIALPAGFLLAPDRHDVPLFAFVWTLRYIRDSEDLGLFWRIIERSRLALLSIASLFLLIFLAAATLAYLFERNAQPDAFGSVPQAMWWAIVSLTTTGYGDVVPVTLWGRFLAGWVMVGGTVMFALQAGIIATAFAEELKRRHFLNTWDLVMAVGFFQGLGAAAIADIVRLLRARDVAAGTAIVRVGEPGDAMYFIVSGECAVQFRPAPVLIGAGGFFGEMALLFGTPRSADVIATKSSVLLVLDIADFRELAGRRPEIVDAIEKEGRRRREENAALHRGQ
jgi:voltage-gated potassium channel